MTIKFAKARYEHDAYSLNTVTLSNAVCQYTIMLMHKSSTQKYLYGWQSLSVNQTINQDN